MQLTTSAFQAGGTIPVQFNCEGDDTSFDYLRWTRNSTSNQGVS